MVVGGSRVALVVNGVDCVEADGGRLSILVV